jgi:hypothetical protein
MELRLYTWRENIQPTDDNPYGITDPIKIRVNKDELVSTFIELVSLATSIDS